jgi:hypothetical protein
MHAEAAVLDFVQPASPSGRLGGRAGQAGFAEVGEDYATQQHGGINTSGPGRVESDLSMKTKTHFAFRVDIWDDTGDSIVEHVAGIDYFEVAEATYRAVVARWPKAIIILRQGARVVHDSRRPRIVK